jgi:hypothetical protein
MNEYELKRIDHNTGHHFDLCNVCARYSMDAMQDAWNDSSTEIKLDELVLDRSIN